MAEEEWARNTTERLPDSSSEREGSSESAAESVESAHASMGTTIEQAAQDLERLGSVAEGPGYEDERKTTEDSAKAAAMEIAKLSEQSFNDVEAIAPAVVTKPIFRIGGENVAPPVVSQQEGAVTTRRIIDIGSNRPRQGVGGEADASVVSSAELIAKMNVDAERAKLAENPVAGKSAVDSIEGPLEAQVADRQKMLDSFYAIPPKQRNEEQLMRIDELEYGNAIDRKNIEIRRNELEQARLASEKKQIDAQVAVVNELLSADPTHPELPTRLKGLTEEQGKLTQALSENQARGVVLAGALAQLTRMLEGVRAKREEVSEKNAKAEKKETERSFDDLFRTDENRRDTSASQMLYPHPQKEGRPVLDTVAETTKTLGNKAIDVTGSVATGLLNFMLSDPNGSSSPMIDALNKFGTWLGKPSVPKEKKEKSK